MNFVAVGFGLPFGIAGELRRLQWGWGGVLISLVWQTKKNK